MNAVYAADVSLNATVTPEKGTVGTQFTYAVSINGIDPSELKITPPEKKTVYPEKDKEKTGEKTGSGEKTPDEYVPLYVITGAERDDSSPGGKALTEIKMNITYYRPGTYALPEIKISGRDGINIGYKIPSVTVEELNREGALEPIEPPVSLSGNYTRIWWIAAGLIAAAAAAFLLYRYLKNRKKPLPAAAPPPHPIEIFLSEVESLKLRELIEAGEINRYVFDISIIFRRYLSSMLMFDAAEMTTEEISSKIEKYMPSELYTICGEEIIRNMRLWDISKFAEFTPSRELLLENLDATISAARRISGIERRDNGTSGL